MSNFQKLTVHQVRKAVDEGSTVHADSFKYKVVKSISGRYYIVRGKQRVGLTWEDGRTLNATKFHIQTPKRQESNAPLKQVIINN